MRTTIVPAQITSVEDKIAGNLTLTQISLLLAPIFIASIVYIVFPPKLHFAFYKLLIILCSILIFSLLALRIKGKIVLQWIVILLRYHFRPRYFIFNKNEVYLRDTSYLELKKNVHKKSKMLFKPDEKSEQHISIKDIFNLEKYTTNPKANVSFRFSQKGGMYVSLSEVE